MRRKEAGEGKGGERSWGGGRGEPWPFLTCCNSFLLWTKHPCLAPPPRAPGLAATLGSGLMTPAAQGLGRSHLLPCAEAKLVEDAKDNSRDKGTLVSCPGAPP